MAPSEKRFIVKQSPDFFPKVMWPYLLILAVLYYASVVFEFRQPFTVLIVVVLIFLVIRELNAANCVLFADQDKLRVQDKKGFWGGTAFSTEYFWKDLESFRYKPSARYGYELQLKWLNWESTHYSGIGVEAFCTYLRTFFPEKEVQTPAP